MVVVIWEFHVKRGREKEFEKIYGPEGEWARFFRQEKKYLKTELLCDDENEGRYLTLDYWNTPEAFAAFRYQHMAEYEAIDRRGEALTIDETRIGLFILSR
jgi:heme-degrading monooxygenase HmoA